MGAEIISISDSDEEAVPCSSQSKSSTSKKPKKPMTPSFSSASGSPASNLDITTQSSFDSGSSCRALYKPLGADLIASRQLALKKKKLSIMHPFPAVRDVVNKIRSSLGTNDSQLYVLGLAQQYISALKVYQTKIRKCPNRCRLLARHIIQTMYLIRDLSRHFFDSPHYSQKISELLAIYIDFELQSAKDFKDSKVKIAERIIHNIHLHLESAKSNFVLRIFSFLSDMSKENEIATKIFERLIPEPTILVKNEFPDRLYVQYLIVFYHWKESWKDDEDKQRVVAFANRFMKPMSTIKTNKTYGQHLPLYLRRDDATGFFLTNLVFFNDLRTASILDGIEDNGPTLVDLSEEEKVYPPIDLSEYNMDPTFSIHNIKLEPIDCGGTVDLTRESGSWLQRLVTRAVALEVILPARLAARDENEAPAVIELDSDSENAERNNVGNVNEVRENQNVVVAVGDVNEIPIENQPEEDDDSWAFDTRNGKQKSTEANNVPVEENSNSMDEIYNELNSSIDFCNDSSTESDIEKKKNQKVRFEAASKLSDAQARLTFDGVVERELKAMYFKNATASSSSKSVHQASSSSLTSINEKPTSSKTTPSAGERIVLDSTEIVEKSKSVTATSIEKQNTRISEAVHDMEKNLTLNEKVVPISSRPAVAAPMNNTILQETPAPKEAVTLTMEESLQSSFDSSDESDESFLGRFQQPPFKTYLRRAHKKSSKKCTKNNASSSEDDANVEKASSNASVTNNRHLSPILQSTEENDDNTNVLFSGKVISLREDENSNGTGGATPNYLKAPESVEISKHGSNVVFSMQGRRLSSFPSLKVTTEQEMSDFDAEMCPTDEEDSNSKSEETKSDKKTKKSNISSNIKSQKASQGTDKQMTKTKSVWFAESPEVREIEPRNSTSSQQKQSSINAISSTINKITTNKQHFASKIFTPQSAINKTTTKPTNNLIEPNKTSKPNHLIKRRITTTEPTPDTAALKSAQEKDLLQILFPEAFSSPKKTNRKAVTDSKTPTIIKAEISSGFVLTPKKAGAIKNRRKSSGPSYFVHPITNKPLKSLPTGSDEPQNSDFDKYLKRKKLLNPQKQNAATKPKNAIVKTEKAKNKRRSLSKRTRTIIASDPKLDGQMKPVVVLNPIAGPVLNMESGTPSEKLTNETSLDLLKLKESPSSVALTAQQRTPAMRTKSLTDILSDVVIQEMAAAAPKEKEDDISGAILADKANNEKSIQNVVTESEVLPLGEKEKEEEKIEESVQPKIVPLINVAVKSQDELELKKIKKEDLELKAPSSEVAAQENPSKSALYCFKKPQKSIAQKRLASASFMHGVIKPVQASKSSPITPFVQGQPSSSETIANRKEIEEPVSSTNSYLFPPLTSESESDSSCRTEQTGDLESSEFSDSSQHLLSPGKSLQVRLRRQAMVQQQTESNGISEIKSKETDVVKKRRGRKSLMKKTQISQKMFEKADSATSSSVSHGNLGQQPPQSGLINGVLVPSIEAMNTPPPTPPTTVDDKSSVADDTSQEAKTRTTPEPSNIEQSQTPVASDNVSNIHGLEKNVATSNIPPNEIQENNENLQVHANQVFDFRQSPGQRRRFESLSLPSKNQKRSRKKSVAEVSDDSPSKEIKKRRKTICTDVFNPPDISSDEENCPFNTAADSPTVDVMQMYRFAQGLRVSNTLSKPTKAPKQDENSSVRLTNEDISPSFNQLCDSSQLSPRFDASSTPSAKIIESEETEAEGSTLRNRPDCDSPMTTSLNLVVSRTYSKSNMVQQVFVPPEIEMFIEEPSALVVEKPTSSNFDSNLLQNITQRRVSNSCQKKKNGNKCSTSDEEQVEDADPRNKKRRAKSTKNMTNNKQGKQPSANRNIRRGQNSQ